VQSVGSRQSLYTGDRGETADSRIDCGLPTNDCRLTTDDDRLRTDDERLD